MVRENRLWSSGCRSRYQGGIGRLKFLKRPFCIIGECELPSKPFTSGSDVDFPIYGIFDVRHM